jgi:hypothetical protein
MDTGLELSNGLGGIVNYFFLGKFIVRGSQ